MTSANCHHFPTLQWPAFQLPFLAAQVHLPGCQGWIYPNSEMPQLSIFQSGFVSLPHLPDWWFQVSTCFNPETLN